MTALPTEPFDDFYGVVLTHVHSGPLLWSASNEAWLRRQDLFDHFRWAEEPVSDDTVHAEEHRAALTAADQFLGSAVCQRCGQEPMAKTHYIAVDVFGAPAVYCVQRPALEVVDSSGGTGSKKHWGLADGLHGGGRHSHRQDGPHALGPRGLRCLRLRRAVDGR